jgi:hypothetical protein
LDEIVHVAANTQACKALGLVASKKMERLSRQTVIWLTDSLDVPEAEEKGKQDFWITQSTQLFREGKASGLANTKRARIPAFFEIDTRAQPVYGRAS